MQACDRCHARKTRCDRRFPQCGACEKARVSCVHADKLRQRNIPRGYLDSMEATVRQLQEENRVLRQSLTASQAKAQGQGQAPQPVPSSPLGTLSSHEEDRQHRQNDGHPDQTPLPEGPISPPPSSVESGSPPENEFAVEVGYLSLIATGETRYLGSSSGLGLANIIGHMVTSQASMDSDGESAPSPLPPLHTVRPFIEAYFQHTHITFPLLHRPSFLATVDRIYGEPGFYERHPREAFVFDMVLAIGSSNFNRFDESAANSCRFFAVAQSKLGAMLSMDDSLTALKAILLISQHGIFSNLRDTSASIWHLVGVGARICIEQGLHLERRQLQQQQQQQQQNGSAHTRAVTLDEELRRRCFWSLYNLDRVVSFTLGRPVAIRDDEIDVPLPSPLDDACFSPDSSSSTDTAAHSPLHPSAVSPFLHLIRIRRISGQILTQFYNSRHHSNISMEDRRRIRRRFHADIDAWRDDTKHLLDVASSSTSSTSSSTPPSSNTTPTYKSSFLSLDWYNAVYSNAILLLYRPSPALPHPTMTLAPDDGRPELIELLNASRSSIESYSRLHQKRRLNYSWITLHGVFIAGLSYIYALGRLLRDPATFALVPELFSIVEVTRSCSNVLVAICERWNASRRSCDLFNKLSNAVIQDALNASSRQAREKDRDRYGSSCSRQSDPLARGHVHKPQAATTPYNNTASTASLDAVLDSQMQLDENFVMDEFRQFMGSLGAGHPGDAMPSEVIAGFLQDWPFDNPIVSSEGENESSMLSWDLSGS
ncbi:c6 zinc finger domain containing protein [Grosmannia clavigera kw1407]|uniref:C6 zinc finger domain containing protein n=1 Tax=Grosmannia clavigera (strain kw1407 / UAMH 11150) TaxID=655863 RepID=F0X797_GROCL|nr:c6 zinc finger domain containing protein [Grosmannia clavigera kw1407]EFX06280.1 c6 zinc finger domain containing protein [Grosmannia clavigera kw1407]